MSTIEQQVQQMHKMFRRGQGENIVKFVLISCDNCWHAVIHAECESLTA